MSTLKTLVLSDNLAREIYPEAPGQLKAILEHTWGKQFFQQSIMDRVKTFEDACMVLNYDSKHPRFSVGDPDSKAYEMLKVIIQALNEGWVPDWNDSNELKWYPWWYHNSPGFRFDVSYCDGTDSCVGSRLVFKTEELSNYAAKQFFQLYKDFLT